MFVEFLHEIMKQQTSLSLLVSDFRSLQTKTTFSVSKQQFLFVPQPPKEKRLRHSPNWVHFGMWLEKVPVTKVKTCLTFDQSKPV